MENTNKLEEVLQIFLITCNRSLLLDNTLRQLRGSPFSACRFTILDNCSTDSTAEVVSRYYEHFSDYHVVRHNKNIGYRFYLSNYTSFISETILYATTG